MIRCRLTPSFTPEGVKVKIEWVEVQGEQVIDVKETEEFVLNRNREGCAYVTRGSFDEGRFLPGTFWVDEKGNRHFVVLAEAGHIGLLGESAAVEKGS